MLALAEMDHLQKVRDVVRLHKDTVRNLILDQLPRDDAQREERAAQVALLYEGALAAIAVSRDAVAAKRAKNCVCLILAAKGDLSPEPV